MFGKGLGKIESKRVSPVKLLKFHNVSNTTVLSKGSHTTLFRNRRNGYDVSLSLYAAHGINISNTISLSLYAVHVRNSQQGLRWRDRSRRPGDRIRQCRGR